MAMLVLDTYFENHLRAEREAKGIDKYDEVWDGVYVMSPLADDEHQELVGEFYALLRDIITRPGIGMVRPGVNVSDRKDGWKFNFRIPDVAVFLDGTTAVNHGTHWQGGPDFAVEVTSESDRTREKLPFYTQTGVRELLIVDRSPWALELYRLQAGRLELVGRSTPEKPSTLCSEVVGLTFELLPGQPRARIHVLSEKDARKWQI